MNIVCYCLQIMQISLMSRTMVQLTGLCLCPFAHYYSCQLLFLASSSLHLLLFLILFCQPIEPLNTFCHPLDANLFKCFYHCKNVFMLWKVTCSIVAMLQLLQYDTAASLAMTVELMVQCVCAGCVLNEPEKMRIFQDLECLPCKKISKIWRSLRRNRIGTEEN